MAKYTAGPWNTHLCDDTIVVDGDGKVIAEMTYDYVADSEIIAAEIATMEANARLIAAAPDLLEALKAFNVKEHYIISGNAETLVVRVPITTLQAAAAAVAKAEAA